MRHIKRFLQTLYSSIFSHLVDWFGIISALTWMGISLFIEPLHFEQAFQRSGSILVAISVLVAVRNTAREERHEGNPFLEAYENAREGTHDTPIGDEFARVENQNKALSRFASALALIGTLIWGYGDLLWNQSSAALI